MGDFLSPPLILGGEEEKPAKAIICVWAIASLGGHQVQWSLGEKACRKVSAWAEATIRSVIIEIKVFSKK
jgi:hypothetical protein